MNKYVKTIFEFAISFAFVSSIFLVVAMCNGCTTAKYKTEEVETKLDVKKSLHGKTIGLDDKGQAVIQVQKDASDELHTQQWINNDLESKFHSARYQLERCREDMADPRLNGSGDLKELPGAEELQTEEELKEQFGLNEDGDLKLVTREFFVERLAKERKYGKTLQHLLQVIGKSTKECERLMGYARIKAGLPAQRYQGDGYFQEGVWIQTKQNEHNLDDAFRIAGSR